MSVGELREIPHDEYVRWCAYFALKAQQEELAVKKARNG